MTRLVITVAATSLAAVLVLPLSMAALTSTSSESCAATQPTSSAAAPTRTRWDDEQRTNAAAVVAVGTRLGVPTRGQVIALATALQESSLRNLTGGDRDSIGLFQQRPSAGWGTPAQLHDPQYAAERFYRALLAVPGWESMPLTEAAQAVQHSAYPDAYADDEADAVALLSTVGGNVSGCSLLVVGSALPSGFTPSAPAGPASQRIARVVGWALLQVGTPYSYGGDCTAAHSGDPRRECDCSSLTQGAYLQAAVSLPRTAAEQSRTGTPVPLSAVQPGDLIFSAGSDGTPAEPGHVAMALGNGWIIEAPHTGLTVRVTQLTPERAAAVVAIRRILTS